MSTPSRILASLFIATAALSAVSNCSAVEKTKAARPNIVYIMADELGYYELGCMGNPDIITPNIDRMAAEGVRFTQALAGSCVCAPTRCVLMTGKHSGHTSVRSNGGGTPLRAGEETIASLLKKAGYATGGFGKWGCGGRGSTGVPEEHGFDIFLGYYDQVHAHTYYPPYLVKNSEEVPLKHNYGGSNGETYSQYVIFDQAINFIKENKDRPFFCYLPITPPHGIFDIPDSDPAWALFKDKDWPEQAKRYAAMVNMVDREVGDVFALLKKLELNENTVVFFCGDNGANNYFRDDAHPRGFFGGNLDPHTGVEFRGHKGNLYEGGLRIPMIARWPGKIEAGRVSNHLCYFPDVMPTLTEIAGTKCVEDTDGISIVPELIGKEAAGREQEQHEYLYWEIGSQTAVRDADWKLYRKREQSEWELYDLKADISETTNVAADNPHVLEKMIGFATAAHTDCVEGTFHNTEIHQRDRQAKYGFNRPPATSAGPVHSLDPKGLIPSKDWKIVSFSSQQDSGYRSAKSAIDGNPRTHWHTQFTPKKEVHPHELVIDLGATYAIGGFRYLARQDGGWNGAIADCEFSISNDPQNFDGPATKATFKRIKISQDVQLKQPAQGRYILITVRSEVNNGPWATISELGVIGK